MKVLIPTNIIDLWTRLEASPEKKVSRHTGTVTETSNLIDALCKKGEGEKQNEQQYRNILNNFHT